MPVDATLVEQAWQRFEADHTNVVLSILLLAQVETSDPTFEALWWDQLDPPDGLPDYMRPDADGGVLLRSASGAPLPLDKLDKYQARRLFESLTPAPLRSVDFYGASRRSVAVALHGAIEAFIHMICPDLGREPLVSAIKPFLDHRIQPLGPESRHYDLQIQSAIDTDASIRRLDASRHVIVHRRAVVDEGYLRAVPDSRYVIGELCDVSYRELWHWQHVVFQVAHHVRLCKLTSA